jgi:methyltransferase (TIGR00027 family)
MKAGQRSRTAEGAAALRASHTLYAESPLFSDPYAIKLTSSGWKRILKSRKWHHFLQPRAFSPIGLLIGQVIGRARYAEDQLANAIARGVNQYVLVGAGLDSFALRQGKELSTLKIFEVDHPDTQESKKQQLALLGDIPKNVEFISINFEIESLFEALNRSTYQAKERGFFSWLGVTHYLQPETTLNTLRAIAQVAASGSEVVFDYSINYQQLNGAERLSSFALSRFTRYMSEPLIGQFDPEELHAALDEIGFDVLEDLSGEAQNERYFDQRHDSLTTTSATHLIHIRVR